MAKKKPEPNPIEEAIGARAKTIDPHPPVEELPQTPKTPDEPSPSEMQTLEELNRRTEERLLRDNPPLTEEECLQQTVKITKSPIVAPKTIKDVLDETIPLPVSKLDRLPVTKTSSPASPPQKIDEIDEYQDAEKHEKTMAELLGQKMNEAKEFHPVAEPIPGIDKLPPDFKVKHTYDTGIAGAVPQSENRTGKKEFELKEEIAVRGCTLDPCVCGQKVSDENINGLNSNRPPAEDIELTALKKYIREDGFVVATVAFHIVSLCAQPMTTPSTTMWDFKDRASIPDMVLALLNQPGYLEGIWPSLRIVMSSNKGNAAWCAGIATTIAFFDTIRVLPALKELQNETEKKS